MFGSCGVVQADRAVGALPSPRSKEVRRMAAALSLAVFLLLVVCTGWTAELYVAPGGSDANPGTRAAPLASLGKAVEMSRAVPAGDPRRIVVGGGKYYEVAVTLGPQDAGLTIEAATGEKPVLYGGRLITGWQKDGDRFFAAPVPGTRDRKWDFRMLAVNGRFCPRARLPREGTFTHLTEFKVPWMGTTGGGWQRKPTQDELTTMQYKPEDLGPWLDINNAEITVYHSWDESVVGIASHDTENHVLRFSTPCGHPPGSFGIRTYVLWNVREGLTEPGQWYLDRTAEKVVYWPLEGEDMASAEVLAPTTESIVRVAAGENAPAAGITLRGLTFSVTNTPLVAGGFGAGRFAGAVAAYRAENCVFEGLTVINVGGQGIKADNCPGLRVERCDVSSAGACGIMARNGDCVLADNYVHHIGLSYPSAIALWGGGKSGKGQLITHNEVHDVPYTGISCGGDDHVVEDNLIYRCMQVMRDGGGIYITFGRRVTCRSNFVHDVLFDGTNTANAYYLDEQAEDCLVEGNLSLRSGSPLLSHWNQNNVLRNNVFIAEGDVLLRWPRSSGWKVERNVIVAGGTINLRDWQGVSEFSNNVLWSGSGTIQTTTHDANGKYQTAPLEPQGGSLIAAPLLVEWEKGVVRFAPDSPALKLGIQPIDVSGAGPRR